MKYKQSETWKRANKLCKWLYKCSLDKEELETTDDINFSNTKKNIEIIQDLGLEVMNGESFIVYKDNEYFAQYVVIDNHDKTALSIFSYVQDIK